MQAANRNVDRLILVHRPRFRPDNDFRRAANHDPMLGTMKVLLQGQCGVWFHHNAFDLVARADVDTLVVAPGSIHPQMLIGLRPILRLELLDYGLALFGLAARSHQYGVRRRYRDDVVEADDGGDDVVVRTRQAVAGISENHGSDADVAFMIVRQYVPDRIPAANIGPAEIDGNDGGARGPLHHGVIDRFLRRPCERFGRQTQEVEIVLYPVDRRFRRCRYVGFEARDFFEHHIGAKQEIAAVPQKTLGNIGAGLSRIRLFDESVDSERRTAVELRARTNVAVAGGGVGRRDAEGYNQARRGGLCRFAASVFQS